MELTRQWCDTKTCPDCGTVEAGNIKVFSYVTRLIAFSTGSTWQDNTQRPSVQLSSAISISPKSKSTHSGPLSKKTSAPPT